jgi:hypothetical protein
MPIETKYEPVIDLMKELDVKDIHHYEENGELRLYGKVHSQEHRSLIIKKIKEINNDNALDISYDLEIIKSERL